MIIPKEVFLTLSWLVKVFDKRLVLKSKTVIKLVNSETDKSSFNEQVSNVITTRAVVYNVYEELARKILSESINKLMYDHKCIILL